MVEIFEANTSGSMYGAKFRAWHWKNDYGICTHHISEANTNRDPWQVATMSISSIHALKATGTKSNEILKLNALYKF